MRGLLPGLWFLAAMGGTTALPAPPAPIRYQLAGTSEWVIDCPTCTPPTFATRLEGQFDLQWIDENPLYATYTVQDVQWRTWNPAGQAVHLRGEGRLVVGGEVALTHQWTLRLTEEAGGDVRQRDFTNDRPALDWSWPHLGSTLTAKSPEAAITLRIRAVPAREVWFLTRSGMTSGATPPPFAHYSGGDILTRDGRRIRTREDLVGRLGLMPPTPPLPIDAIEVLPGGEVAFSLRDPVFSETLGTLGDGDLLTASGRIAIRNADLVERFGPAESTDAGLDAVQRLPDGEILFSIARPLLLKDGGRLEPGDILSRGGRVLHHLAGLIAPFEPDASADLSGVGIDAFHVWPTGEVWFSVSMGFPSATHGYIGEGDLLSSHGRVIWRNLDLVGPFQPLEDLADFGLDGLFIVSDLEPPPPAASLLLPGHVDAGLQLTWTGSGRVHQVESAADPVHGPWIPAGPVLPDTRWTGSGAGPWFRLRSW